MKDTVVIGGASGAWGDSSFAAPQLLASGRCDYVIFEGLAEITMAILARARQRDPSLGYATDIIEMIGRDIADYRRQGIAVITNAGGVNPQSAAARLQDIAAAAGITLAIATVSGDDLLGDLAALRAAGVTSVDGAPLADNPLCFNAYLGARPIAAALAAGADVVISGRCVDSALVLGPLIHEFGWGVNDLDALSQGSLAGHLLECGPQATGGLLSDWQDIPSWEDIGYPIAECRADGSFVLSKPEGSGGLVDRRSVAEQLLYEIGDPAAYLLPDVSCDWRQVRLAQVGPDRVLVSGARGWPAPTTLKACAQIVDGFKLAVTMFIGGHDAVAKAERLAADMLTRADRVLTQGRLAPLSASRIDVLGAEASYGPHARARASREVMLRLALSHPHKHALSAVVRELASFGLAVPGVANGGTGLARPTPLLRLQSSLIERQLVRPHIELGGHRIDYDEPAPAAPIQRADPSFPSEPPRTLADPVVVPLSAIAHARSGDKGADSNIGVRARHPDFVSLLRTQLSAETVASWLAHLIDGSVVRYELPGIDAFNFVLSDALGGGGIASLRLDAQGKAHAQQLLDIPISLPRAWLNHPGLRSLK